MKPKESGPISFTIYILADLYWKCFTPKYLYWHWFQQIHISESLPCAKLFSVKSFKKSTAACPLSIFFLSLWLEYLVGYLRSARFLGSDVCAIVTICQAIKQSGEGCPCQEGGQGTNSFLFLDTFIYQAWLHASHTLKVGLCACLCVRPCVGVLAKDRVKDSERQADWCGGQADGCGRCGIFKKM